MDKELEGVIIFGAPGTGKGEQSRILDKTGKFFHFSTGDMFRNLDPSTNTGKEIKKLIDKGILVPDELTIKLFDETIMNLINKGRYDPELQFLLLDGIPRTTMQAKLINERVNIRKIIYLETPYDAILKRNKKRAGEENRVDDDPSIFKNRLETYEKQTFPILNLYKKELIIKIDNSGTIEEVHKLIMKELKELMSDT